MSDVPNNAGQHHLHLQRREWLIQRIAWVVMLLVLAGAVAGVFGKGPLSQRTLGSDRGGVGLQYERLVRFQDILELQVTIDDPRPGPDGLITLVIGDGYFDNIRVESIAPEPESQSSQEGSLVLRFRPAGPGMPMEVEIRGKVEHIGSNRGRITLMGPGVPDTLHFEQFAYP